MRTGDGQPRGAHESQAMHSPLPTWNAYIAVALLAVAGCGGEVVTGQPPIDDYKTWDSFQTEGKAPGHGDTVRIIYANETARSYQHGGRYLIGTTLVKEIYEKRADGSAGDLRYLAVMRRLQQTEGGELHNSWLFTSLGELGDDEVYDASCWNRCHVQAPVDGAWFDYGR